MSDYGECQERFTEDDNPLWLIAAAIFGLEFEVKLLRKVIEGKDDGPYYKKINKNKT